MAGEAEPFDSWLLILSVENKEAGSEGVVGALRAGAQGMG